MRTTMTHAVQVRKHGSATWKDMIECESLEYAIDYFEDVKADGKPCDYRMVERTHTTTERVI